MSSGQDRPISEIVGELCQGEADDRITLEDLLSAFGLRAFGLLVLVFALPNGVPAPIAPGLSAILGAPLLLIGVQMVLGFNSPWFPLSWRARSFRRADVARLLRPAIPWLVRLERYIRPRLPVLTGWAARRLIGAMVLWNAFLLSLPVPFGNLIPAWAIILTAIGQVERDGHLVLAGGIASLLATGWVWFLIDVGLALIERLFT
ncbi:MAG TPA: exopolysaccharide biosynthesis protein [Ferrovibrio sp.]|uniref:exopolysaccharide biosynthesis protein n=1 Tax=Ferrovibrio sp. TaxID=1917215 RepID=UPI002B4B84AB|nr:exopolysaccharide biosynthesis protein [Ferrovibrio sp.]HLT76150.1 exopolysaccharide biosynthesis protein [Ferrovibrio sp.]